MTNLISRIVDWMLDHLGGFITTFICVFLLSFSILLFPYFFTDMPFGVILISSGFASLVTALATQIKVIKGVK